ncbi:MAG TPA: CBS domain-containing protein [Thermovirgaceae bacterium]|nr:CBS domain-containing protein [Thermovirgaceae bacterium]
MKIITTHIGADFDSLASMVAASKLYPGARPCFSGSAGRNVREFLKRNPGRWNILTPSQVEMDKISTLIVVDARSPARIASFAGILERQDLEVHIYDHHAAVQDDITADFSLIEPVGATTTLLVEMLIDKGIEITPQEATLFAMGIYEDTGALTFGATTERDFMAVIRLRSMGSDMTAIPAHIELSLDSSERRILDRLIESARERYIQGAKVVLSSMSHPDYVEGLSLFVHRLRDYFDADVALAAVRMEKRVYVVARGKEEILDVAKFLSPLGGGGHSQAASVTLTGEDPQEILGRLESRLEKEIQPLVTVEDVMTSPVMVITPDMSVEEAYRLMIRYGHAALPVSVDGRLLGIITRKDLDKARIHGLGSALVEDYMTGDPVTILPDASVAEAHRMMVLRNIGRIPVTSGEEILGIVTRTDILRALFPRSLPVETRSVSPEMPWMENVSGTMSGILDTKVLSLLYKLGDRASSLGFQAYVVGGFVRDLLLARPNEDLDIVVEGDAVAFLESWVKDGCRVAIHQRFRTGTIVFPDGRKVDVATARREFYEYPVAQPRVSIDSLKHDLYRRDYSVNAMAVSITRGSWGVLVDYFGGRNDTGNRSLRVLHNLSFVEDPTRVIRGIRLEQRLDFTIEDNTLRLLENCIKGGLLSLLSGVRLRSEIELVFREEKALSVVRRLKYLGFWRSLFPGLILDIGAARALRRLGAFRKRLMRDIPDLGEKEWLASLMAVLVDSPDGVETRVLDRLSLSPGEREIVIRGIFELGSAEHRLGGRGEKKPSHIMMFLQEYSPVTAIFWAAATGRWRVRRRILLYLTRLQKVEPMLSGRDVLEMGYHEGPLVGVILSNLKMARLDGEVESREDEIEWIKENYSAGSFPALQDTERK